MLPEIQVNFSKAKIPINFDDLLGLEFESIDIESISAEKKKLIFKIGQDSFIEHTLAYAGNYAMADPRNFVVEFSSPNIAKPLPCGTSKVYNYWKFCWESPRVYWEWSNKN